MSVSVSSTLLSLRAELRDAARAMLLGFLSPTRTPEPELTPLLCVWVKVVLSGGRLQTLCVGWKVFRFNVCDIIINTLPSKSSHSSLLDNLEIGFETCKLLLVTALHLFFLLHPYYSNSWIKSCSYSGGFIVFLCFLWLYEWRWFW